MSDSRKRPHAFHPHSTVEQQGPRKKQKRTLSVETLGMSLESEITHKAPDDNKFVLQDAVTGSLLTLEDAPSVMDSFFFNASIGQPNVILEEVSQDTFVCRITFPPDGPLKKPVIGPMHVTKSLAKQRACFRVCRKLVKRGLLNHTVFPQATATSGNVMRSSNNKSSKHAKAVHLFPKKSALFWTHLLGPSPKRLYTTVVSITSQETGRYGSFVLFTKRILPTLPPFIVFESGHRAVVKLKTGAPFKPTEEQLSQLHGYSLRVFRSIANKPFSMPVEMLSYLVAPLQDLPENWSTEAGRWRFPNVLRYIPWEQISLGVAQWKLPLVSEDGSLDVNIDETIVHDRAVEFTNRLYVRKVRYDMSPKSKIERDAGSAETFLDHVKARVKGFDGLRDNDQPMLEVEPVPAVFNHLNPHHRTQLPKSSPKYLIPELCHRFVIPASIFRSLLLLPSIIHRIDQLLVATELNHALFNNKYSLEQVLTATSSTAGFGDHNYERLEFLGDASLKLMSSTYCYLKMPNTRESALHNARQKIISNSALYVAGNQAGLPAYIQNKPFIPKIWQPDIPLPDSENAPKDESGSSEPKGKRRKQKESRYVQWIAEKTVADVVEALIAVAYLSGGNAAALEVAKSLHVDMPGVSAWSDFRAMSETATADFKATLAVEFVHAVETFTGAKFKQPEILAQALTHPSLHSEDTRSYEQLEFLGDAVLDFLVSRYVYHAYPGLAPGGMTMLKAAMVSNATLATLSVLSGLHRHLRHTSEDLSKAFAIFEKQLHRLRATEHQEARAENRSYRQYWLELSPSKALSDVLEAVLAAIYIADGLSMSGVETFFNKLFKPFYDRYIRLQSLSHHPNKTLYDLFHQLGCRQHHMTKEVRKDGVHCRVLVHGIELSAAVDKSSSLVTRKTATTALEALQNQPDFMSRACDCRVSEGNNSGESQLSGAQLGYDG